MVALAFFVACKDSKSTSIKIGISKIVSHPALDSVEKGIQDELKEEGFTNITYDLQNANGELSTAASIAQKFKADKVDIAVGIATPTSQALYNTLKDSVIIYSAVTDPVDAGLVKSYKAGEKNIAGVSDMTPVKDQIAFLKKIKDIKRLGHIYASHEANAVALAKVAKEACKELGIEFVETTVTNSSEVKQAAQTIADRVDAFYLSTDNTVISAIAAVADVAKAKKIPIMSADPSSAEKFEVLAAWGFDYYKMGRATGKLIGRILKGEKPENIPTIFMTDPSDVDLLINLDVAKRLNINIADDIKKKASRIIENGKLIKK
ncbi:MAG TPA: ABC transporter substrate-binding protein [Spirochaetota bacterium]|jgi:putative ABC transport system substrate-binding protein|nr:ABC transporter substrate-binding protein [Spirochaetota bacterium]HOK93296.1 ABC transporter substrate-binding protein [Spirochaetota bacterium]HON15133.1 ABC transporter substrate-binding protein [Spirochaetota bacterium]HOQ11440.1 ABC transporter substrate-binding protein [Spirochaetota bacterium]HOV09184.1 ABC transporter substrate-binding protein [Spirochaetota bacterium]